MNNALFKGNKKHQTKVAVYEAWLSRNPGLTAKKAEQLIADRFAISQSSVRRYIKEINTNGYTPRPKPTQGRSVFAWDIEAVNWMKAYFLAAQSQVKECGCTRRNAYRAVCKEAALRGWKVGTEPSAYKHLEDIHALLLEYTKGGTRALDNLFYIARDLTHLKPFEVIVGDQHIFDFWVIADNGEKIRPQCYLWLDMRTRLPYGIAFEQGAYNFRTVARSLRSGIERFGKFNSTYNDNGKPEISGKINHLVSTLQTFGMKFTDEAELYKTPEGKYAIEDANGNTIAIAQSPEQWHKRNRRIFAKVKNAKTKPIERFFSTLEQLLLDKNLPGAVRRLNASAPEEEKAAARLDWQEKSGYLLHFDEFVNAVCEALETYETRTHSTLKISPRAEMEKAIQFEGFTPTFIEPSQIAYIFMEPYTRKVHGNRITACGQTFIGPDLTAQMVKENRGNLAGLSGLSIEVRIDPDNPTAGAFAIDPRNGKPIFLTPEVKINPLDDKEFKTAIEQKKHNIKAVTEAFKQDTAEFFHLSKSLQGTVLSASSYKPLDESKKATQKAIEYTASSPDFTNEELAAQVQELLQKEQSEHTRQVYACERDRFEAIIDSIIAGANITRADMEFKIDYEKTMSAEERIYIENKIAIGKQKLQEITKWN